MLVDECIFHALCHATYNAHNQAFAAAALQRVQLVEARENLLLGVVANRAGVDEDCIGFVEVLGYVVACHFHHRSHNFAVCHVHLAAVGFDVQMLGKLLGSVCEVKLFHSRGVGDVLVRKFTQKWRK